ncbi:hypothetical protein ccbrp13_31330 [Ktedonobacteria bacterium brp13]|nr:hypothetical protein ccbrp13_31330 [Ktedonobacteria bacterium brp13]
MRFLGVVVYIFKEDAPQGRYNIRLAPPELMRALRIVPKGENIGRALSGMMPAKGMRQLLLRL